MLWFDVAQAVGPYTVWELPNAARFLLNLVVGDAEDAAIAVSHWFITKALPLLEPELDPAQAARRYEDAVARSSVWTEAPAGLWAFLGHPEEAERFLQRFPI